MCRVGSLIRFSSDTAASLAGVVRVHHVRYMGGWCLTGVPLTGHATRQNRIIESRQVIAKAGTPRLGEQRNHLGAYCMFV